MVSNDWPTDESVFRGVSAVFMFCTGGEAHPAIKPERLKLLSGLMDQGVGFGTCHYGVEVPKGDAGDAFLKWQGGYFEAYWSVNPHWSRNANDRSMRTLGASSSSVIGSTNLPSAPRSRR